MQSNNFHVKITRNKNKPNFLTNNSNLIFFQSKNIMYDFWFNILTKNSPCQFDLGMSDTDILLFKVTKPQQFWNRMDDHMDYSNYDPTHPKFNLDNKARLG